MGKDVGKENISLNEYLNLWIVFEKLLEKKQMKLPTFAKSWDKLAWETYSDNETPEKAFYSNLKKMQSNKDSLTRVNPNSVKKIKKYIEFLNKDFIEHHIHEDESYTSWFD